jgi:hypothetical protein
MQRTLRALRELNRQPAFLHHLTGGPMDYLVAIAAASFIAVYALIVWRRLPKQ